jgi:hypothetical protein
MFVGGTDPLFEHASLQPAFGSVFKAFALVGFVSIEFATADE